jgi:hypothetical protein
MKQFSQYTKHTEFGKMLEQAIARYGDYPIDMEVIHTKLINGEIPFDVVGTLDVKSSYGWVVVSTTPNHYWVGYTENEDFVRVGEIKLRDEPICNKSFKSVNLVRINADFRMNGIASSLYRFISKDLNIHLISDVEQYFGARKLWSRLSITNRVDVINTKTCELLHSNYLIYHGQEDYEFDANIWSYDDNEIPHIRLILKDIK